MQTLDLGQHSQLILGGNNRTKNFYGKKSKSRKCSLEEVFVLSGDQRDRKAERAFQFARQIIETESYEMDKT